jgi:hypothetical protein
MARKMRKETQMKVVSFIREMRGMQGEVSPTTLIKKNNLSLEYVSAFRELEVLSGYGKNSSWDNSNFKNDAELAQMANQVVNKRMSKYQASAVKTEGKTPKRGEPRKINRTPQQKWSVKLFGMRILTLESEVK